MQYKIGAHGEHETQGEHTVKNIKKTHSTTI